MVGIDIHSWSYGSEVMTTETAGQRTKRIPKQVGEKPIIGVDRIQYHNI